MEMAVDHLYPGKIYQGVLVEIYNILYSKTCIHLYILRPFLLLSHNIISLVTVHSVIVRIIIIW